MSKLHLIWAAASIALAFGIDARMQPEVERSRPESELRAPTGTLALSYENERVQLPLIDARIVARDIEYPFGKRVPVRELWFRSPGEGEPDLELFVAFDDGGMAADARDLRPVVHQTLPVLPEVTTGPHSRVTLAGTVFEVVEGTCVLSQALPMEHGEDTASWRVTGELELMLRTEGAPKPARATFKARVVW